MLGPEEIAGAMVLLGLGLLVTGVIAGNVAVFRMILLLNSKKQNPDVISWFLVGKASSFTIKEYREQEGDGPLYRQMKLTYWIDGTGVLLFVVGLVFGKVFVS